MSLISLVVILVVIGLLFWVVRTLVPVLGIPQPVATVIYVILVAVVVLYLLQLLGVGMDLPTLRLR